MSELALAPRLARIALAELWQPEVARLIAYAEAFALVVAGLGADPFVPSALVRHTLRMFVEGRARWAPGRSSLESHLRAVVRAAMEDALHREAATRSAAAGVAPSMVRLSTAQVGDLAGIFVLAHRAGELNASIRDGDSTVVKVSAQITDWVRGRLEDLVRLDREVAPGDLPSLSDIDTRRLESAERTPREIRRGSEPR
jgi:hypothetical protein